jgi:DNA-binding beta-propeller fold protein YncE
MHNSKIVLCAILLAIFVSSSFVLISQPLDSFGKHSVAMANASYEPMSVVANITLGKKPFCIAVNEETNRVYVGVTGGLMVISGETDQVIAEIPLGADVRVLAVNPLTNRIYAGISDNITVIDGATNLIVKTKPGGVYSSYDVAFDPVANRLYEGWSGPHMGDYDGVNVYDLEYFWFITRVDLSFTSYFENVGVAVNPKTNRVYATWTGNDSLYMIDGNTLTIIKKVNPSSFSTEMMINSYTNNVYIGNTVLNGETLEQVASNYTGDIQAIDQIHNLLYTVDYEWITLYDNATKNYYSIMNSSLYRLDGSTHGVIDSLNLNSPFHIGTDHIAVNPKTSKIYITFSDENQTCVVNVGALPQPSATPYPTPVPTPTPSSSPTPTPIPTPTPTPSPSPSPSPTHTPTPSPTPIASPSPSPTATPPSSATPTPASSPTASPTPTPTPTPSPSPSHLPSTSPSTSPSPTPSTQGLSLPMEVLYAAVAVIIIVIIAVVAVVLKKRQNRTSKAPIPPPPF